MQKNIRFCLTIIASIAAMLTSATAQTPKLHQEYKAWGAFSHSNNGKKICFAATQPIKSEANKENISRDPAFFFVSREPSDNIVNEVNLTIGYPFKTGSEVIVQIGSDKFEFFTQGDGAWIKNAALESAVVDAIKRGSNMIITGTSQRNTITTDTYSLSGATAAINRITKECPV